MLIVVHLAWSLCLLSLFKGQTSGFTILNNYHQNNSSFVCIKFIQSKYNIIYPNWKAHKIYIINRIKYHNYSNNSQEFNIYHSVSLLHHVIPLSLPISLACLHAFFQTLVMSVATWWYWGGITMAHFDTDYQRLEASYSDSPPGEENLLMHVPEGAKCMTFIIHVRSLPLPWLLS